MIEMPVPSESNESLLYDRKLGSDGVLCKNGSYNPEKVIRFFVLNINKAVF